MESDDFNAFEHLTPTGPPPLPGPDDLYPPDHPVPTHVFSPTPRRVLPRPGGEPLTTNFVINQHYLSLLASLDLREPRSAEPGVPFRTNLHAGSQSAGLEPIEEEQSQRSSPLRSLASSPPGPGDKVKSVSHLAVAMLGYTPHGAGADRGMSWLEGITSTEEGDSSILPQPTSLNPPPISEVFENHSMDLEPETQNLNAIVEPQGDPTGADQTICPVVPEMTAVDPACTFPTERPPAFELPPPSPEQTPPTTALLDVQPKPQAMRGSIRPPEQVSAEVAQWRTGKSPGYQGLTQKRRSSALSDEEDEPHDIGRSAVRVLKRPFKPPTVMKAPMVRLKARQVDSGLSKPLAAPTRRLGTTLRSKPFRTPSATVGSCSPLSRSASSKSSSGKAMDLNLNLIATLETRLRTMRQAIKYDDPEEDRRVVGLIHTWREAGREIADRLFALLPAPSEDSERNLPTSRWDDWGFAGKDEASGFSKEQLEYLRSAPTDAQGDVLDEAGNRIFGDEGDLGSLIDQAMSGTDYVVSREPDPVNDDPMTSKDDAWDKGVMLLRFGVDPDLFGWDREGEDWAEVTDG